MLVVLSNRLINTTVFIATSGEVFSMSELNATYLSSEQPGFQVRASLTLVLMCVDYVSITVAGRLRSV